LLCKLLLVFWVKLCTLLSQPAAVEPIDLGLHRKLDRTAAAWKPPLGHQAVYSLEKFLIQRDSDFGRTHLGLRYDTLSYQLGHGAEEAADQGRASHGDRPPERHARRAGNQRRAAQTRRGAAEYQEQRE
jgi:hypothetical protein